MHDEAKLPAFLWVEIYKTAVYLNNRTPKQRMHWLTPYEMFHTFLARRDGIIANDRKPQQAHLRAYGCKAFAITKMAQEKEMRL